MKTYIVAKAFQHRATMWRAGQAIKLSDAEATDPFVAAHVKAAVDGQQPAMPVNYLGNGKLKGKEETPAKIAGKAGSDEGMSAKELRQTLAKLGVPCPPNATKEDMSVLLAQAQAAVAGSPDTPNRPGVTGVE